ncbi:MAG: glycosyltransferase family protein, partial [Luminiphilus sp.]
MRILYGVQATGQGHISRARAMAQAFKQHPDVDVTWLFSGRPRERLFDMGPFGDFQHRAGLTFVTEAGRLRYRKTIMANRYWQFIRDVQRLDVTAYDLVVTDYEPVTAWAGKLKGQSVLGIGHQYAFG